MVKPRLLDLFCGAGGAGMGYHRAGFEVIGIDIELQPNYPFEFYKADALDELGRLVQGREHGWGRFSAVHASPPCQGYSRMRHLPWLKDRVYPMLIDPVRELLQASGLPYVIENVEDAPLLRRSDLFGGHGVWLCGLMFGLPLYRHRVFESSFSIEQPYHPKHQATIFSSRYLNKRYSQSGGVAGVIPSIAGHTSGVTKEMAERAMGIDWMRRDELTQAIPPAMTEFIGSQLLASISVGEGT